MKPSFILVVLDFNLMKEKKTLLIQLIYLLKQTLIFYG